MKKVFTAAVTAAALFMPALAQPDVEPYSYDSMGCMKLGECKIGVYELTSVDWLMEMTNNKGFERHRPEIESLLASMNKVGIKVYVAEGPNFPKTHRGVYYTDNNSFYLNLDHVQYEDKFMEVFRHEGWHAAQDCMAGSIDNSMIAVIHMPEAVPQEYHLSAEVRYGMLEPKAIPWEREALWAGSTPGMTDDALKICASGAPMWYTYEPTPKTAWWLQENGYNLAPYQL